MFIKTMTLEGVEGDVEIRHTETGALVIANDEVATFDRTDSGDDRFAVARAACLVLLGATDDGDEIATVPMINEVLRQIERVAGF